MSLTKVTYSMIAGASANVVDYGADPANANNGPAFNAAFAALSAAGGGQLLVPPGIFNVGETISIPNDCALQGAGQFTTTIKLAASANVNIIEADSGAGLGIGIYDLTIDGNQANNTQGGLSLAGANNARGPTFQIERVTVTHCRNAVIGSGIKSCFIISGNAWSVLRDIDIIDNDFCQSGLWMACADSQVDGLYLGTNGRSAAPNFYNCGMYVTGASNLFTNCYFGGTQQNSQILFNDPSASVNKFVNCIVDNSGASAVSMIGGADGNTFVGCKFGNSSYSDGGTYYTIFNESGVGLGGTFIGCEIYSDYATDYATNGYYEPSYLAAKSQFVGCAFNGTFDNGPVALGTNSQTEIVGCMGYDYSNLGIARNKLFTVATLPSAATAGSGATAFVSDATATTFASIVAGGGANAVPVYSDGTNWRIG